ncbi:hypothetical protein BFX06_09905 [Sulfobacillus thermosulfidooxidans]|nr:hypothetical protein BFX05_08475 [Sulfobacillus thermosulfidooxidans]OLZ13473.1 hypothetical protein BFX06_09905 [Sulfobacillus thermosulfidooxidans]OLZ20738.1 hypothetical protein BFX07_14330 [Sulfobacillus thermosulfidooxidans]
MVFTLQVHYDVLGWIRISLQLLNTQQDSASKIWRCFYESVVETEGIGLFGGEYQNRDEKESSGKTENTDVFAEWAKHYITTW